MSIQLTRYFRVLVIGEENKFAGDIIERDLGFRIRLVPQDQIEEAIRGSADCGAIVVSRPYVEAVVKTRDEHYYIPLHHQVIVWAMRDNLDIEVYPYNRPIFAEARFK